MVAAPFYEKKLSFIVVLFNFITIATITSESIITSQKWNKYMVVVEEVNALSLLFVSKL